MNLPNKITILRVILVPVFAALALVPFNYHLLIAALVFALAAASDFIDGYLARSLNKVSNFGKFMDPLADKMLVNTALLTLVALGSLPVWVAIVIICRDLAVDGLRFMAAERGVVIAASRPAKLKTLCQMIMVVLLLVAGLFPYAWYAAVCRLAVAIAVALTVYSGVEYLIKGREFFSHDSNGTDQ